MTDGPRSDDPSALSRMVGVLGEDAIFVLAAGALDRAALEALGHRRAADYSAALGDRPPPRMLDQFDAWVIALARAMAPIAPPAWVPMMEVVREKVTLEIGARGLRSLFSNKPSEKEVARVKRYGALAVRVLRSVFAADGPLDAEERTTIAAVVAALGLPEADADALSSEPPVPADALDVYGEIEHAVARAVVRGAWMAAVADGIDPREERVIRVVAQKVGVPADEIESARRGAQERIEARSRMGGAAVDGIRFVLGDRQPGPGLRIAALVGALMIPRRARDEALAAIGQRAPVVLARRHDALQPGERGAVLGLTWAAALLEDPSLSRRAVLRARWERFATDLGEDDPRPREVVEAWIDEMLTSMVRTWV